MLTHFSALIFTVLVLLFNIAWADYEFMKNFPTAHTANNRVIGFLLAFNWGHIDPLILIIEQYVAMCEAGWSPTLVFHTTVHWSDTMHRYMREKTWCYRIDDNFPIIVDFHKPKVGTGLAAYHRVVMARELDNHDVFIYHEDDILFKYQHLVAYLNETILLDQLLPEKGLYENTVGFQRYRRLRRNDIHSAYGEQDIFEQELLEEMPIFNPICIGTVPYFLIGGNIHQAMWVFTRQQVLMLQDKCSFLNHSSPSREFMSSFSFFDHKPHHCQMNKLIPGERLSTFSIYHYYEQRHVSWTPVFSAAENMMAGFHYYAEPKAPLDVPKCWRKIVKKHYAEQYPSPTAAPVPIDIAATAVAEGGAETAVEGASAVDTADTAGIAEVQ